MQKHLLLHQGGLGRILIPISLLITSSSYSTKLSLPTTKAARPTPRRASRPFFKNFDTVLLMLTQTHLSTQVSRHFKRESARAALNMATLKKATWKSCAKTVHNIDWTSRRRETIHHIMPTFVFCRKRESSRFIR